MSSKANSSNTTKNEPETSIQFTKSKLDALQSPEKGKRTTYHDTGKDAGGLQLRITSTGTKTFTVLRRVKGGRPERVTIGRYPDITIAQARKQAREISNAMANGQSVADIARAKRQTLTLGEWFEDFLKNKRNKRGAYLSEKTKLNYESDFKLHLSSIANRKLTHIKSDDISTIHTTIGKSAPYAANRVLALVSTLFNYARERKIFSGENPASGIKKFPETSRERFLQADELPRFFQALADEPNEDMRDYFLVLLLTGARRSNALEMMWENVNLDRAEWFIATTKNSSSQTVTLTPEVIEVLRNRKPSEASGYVFPGAGRHGHLVEPKTAWKRILDRAGLADLRIHDLRRTLGSWQAKTGASMAIIGKSLNHKNQSTTAIYARLDLDPVRASVETATAAILEAAGLKQKAEVASIKKSI